MLRSLFPFLCVSSWRMIAGLPLSLRGVVLVVLLLSRAAGPLRADDWPQWLGPQRDGIWRETGLLEKFPPGGPRVLWRTEIGSGFAGPAVADGRVYVMDRQGAKLPKGAEAPPRDGGLAGSERILCLDAATG